jgi:hypothetical protein
MVCLGVEGFHSGVSAGICRRFSGVSGWFAHNAQVCVGGDIHSGVLVCFGVVWNSQW